MDSPSDPVPRNPGTRVLLLVLSGLLLSGLLLFAGYRIVAMVLADGLASGSPRAALEVMPAHPGAMLALAERQLAAGRDDDAARTARELLSREPLTAGGFRILALVAAASDDRADAQALMEVAARRAPRDMQARGWLAQSAIERGDHAAGLDQVEAVLRLLPMHADALVPLLAELAADPAFAQALGHKLREQPRWRGMLLGRLMGDAGTGEAPLESLLDAAAATAEERLEWAGQLVSQRRWGPAYAVWAAAVAKPDGRLDAVFDGGFDGPLDRGAFGWQLAEGANAVGQLVPDPAGSGRRLQLSIESLQPGRAWLWQRMLLAPGRYRLRAGVAARATLGGDLARPQWRIECLPGGALLAERAIIPGPVRSTLEFTVPPDCTAQRLGFGGDPLAAAATVSVDYWIDDIVVQRLDAPGAGAARITGTTGLVMVDAGQGFRQVRAPAVVPLRGRVLVAPGARARLALETGCELELEAIGVHEVPPDCVSNAGETRVEAASDRVRRMQLGKRIAGLSDPFGPVPAGR